MINVAKEHLDFINKAFRLFLPDNTEVIFFGSRVSGNNRLFSDLDIAIKIGDQPAPLAILSQLNNVFDGSSIPFRIDISDYNTMNPEFQDIVRKTGISQQVAE